MSKDAAPKNLNTLGIAVTSVVTIITTVVASYLFFALTNRSPDLKYEIAPISSFQNQNNSLSIVNIRIFNSGNKEVENINGLIEISSINKISETSISPSSKAIVFHSKDSLNSISFDAPLLNAGDQITFSLLVNSNITDEKIKVYLRGNGINGNESKISEFDDVFGVNRKLFIGTLGMLIITIGLILFIIYHQRKVIRYQLKLHMLQMKQVEVYKNKLKEFGVNLDDLKIKKNQETNLENSDKKIDESIKSR